MESDLMSETFTLQELPELLEKYTNEYTIQRKPRPLSRRDFVAAFLANWELIVGGVVLGVTLAFVSHLNIPGKGVDVLLEVLGHIGHGLVVSSIAVLAFEWVAEAKKAQALTWALIRLMTSGQMEKLENALGMLLGGESQRFKSVALFTSYVSALRTTPNWARDAFLEFLGSGARALALNARDLSKLCRETQAAEPSFTRFALTLQHPGKVADRLLKKLLVSLPRGSSYDAVSNALIWRDLTDFQKAHEDAVTAGVRIRRVFVIFQPSDDIVPDDQAINTVYHHFELSSKWGTGKGDARYEMRFVTQKRYKEAAPTLYAKLNFGVFVPPIAAGKPVAFDVKADNLTEFDIHIVNEQDAFITEFDNLWDACGVTTDLGLRYALRAERMRRMKSGSYSAVSAFDNWTNEQLDQLHKDAMDASKRGVQIRRIFVSNNSSKEMLPILREHAEARRLYPRYDWLLCAPEDLPPSLIRYLPIPFGIFEDLAPVGTQRVLYEAYSGNVDREFELPHDQSSQIFDAFNAFWDVLRKRETDTLTERFGPVVAAALNQR